MSDDLFKEFTAGPLGALPELRYPFESTAILRWLKGARTASWFSIAPSS